MDAPRKTYSGVDVLLTFIARIGAKIIGSVGSFGRFWWFGGTLLWRTALALPRYQTWRNVMPQFFEVGNRTLPVILITGVFVGLVLAIQAYDQLDAAGFRERMGQLINLTLVKELGPVLAGVMLAGRVGGALTAELGTMNVTEQLDAYRVMGADPIRHLVVPRFLACLLLTPLLTVFCDLAGSLSGWFIAVVLKNVPNGPYWYLTADAMEKWDFLVVGFTKSFMFGGAIGTISCYKGFYCRPGAEGVGRACTESFVANFIALLILDFLIATCALGVYKGIWGFKSLI